jgi:hypothetical protein
MILGRGDAQTDAAIVAEYHRFLNEYGNDYVPVVSRRYHRAPALMQQRLGKPPSQWNEDDILRLSGVSLFSRVSPSEFPASCGISWSLHAHPRKGVAALSSKARAAVR